MRFLVPLLTAAALAIAGWLANGIVTVRSLDAPDRIGLLAPPHVLLTYLLPLLALSGVGLAESGRWRTVRRAVLLLAPVALPWLPLPLAPALLTWTGPLALLWWAASIAYVYADAFARMGRRLEGLVWSSSRAPLLAAAIAGAALVATAWHTAPQHPEGDEPDYLVIAQSLWLDHDLKIEDNHARADYASYHPAVLPPSYLARGTNGAIYSVHAPGLPAVLVPGVAVAGYHGAIATMVLLAMVGAWLTWRVSWEVTADAPACWVGTLATVGAAPYFLHGAAIFPDAPASALALYAVRVLLTKPARGVAADRALPTIPVTAASGVDASARRPYLLAALALAMLPWLHTRYAILAVGLGAALALNLVSRREWRSLVMFAAPATVLAVAWFGMFLVIYGTPSPSAPYGAYTQMALAHLRPGVPGVLFDQQFGLLASAPVLVVALVSLRPAIRESARHTWRVALLVVVLGLSYTCVVAAYRMWWGGLSAPARFLVPLVLPLAPFIAVGWQSLRTRASRHLALALLIASLSLTATLAVVDQGALAYNTRDGRARWASWASPLVDLVAALPAAHRDAPGVVLRDAGIWITALGGAWALWRVLDRRGRLSPLVSLMSVAVVVPAASASVWAAHGVSGLAPSASQVRYLEGRASAPDDMLVAITRPPVGRTRSWFDVELDSRRQRAASDYTLLRLDHVPAGRYRLFTDIRMAGARLGVTLGDGRTSRFIADLEASSGRVSRAFDLALPAADLVVKGSREAAEARGRTWLVADDVARRPAVPAATRAVPFGDGVWLLPEDGIYPEADGAWLAGDTDVTIGVPESIPRRVSLRAGAASVEVSWSGAGGGDLRLAAGETRIVTMVPDRGRLRLRTRGGFRPARETPGSGDQRYLSVWLSVG